METASGGTGRLVEREQTGLLPVAGQQLLGQVFAFD